MYIECVINYKHDPVKRGGNKLRPVELLHNSHPAGQQETFFLGWLQCGEGGAPGHRGHNVS